MIKALTSIDISHVPDLVRLAEEVASSGEPRVLRRDSEELAILVPVKPSTSRRPKSRVKTEEDLAAFRAAAGTWTDVDTDKLIEDIYESRLSSRPPIEL